jgi:hypothetical protein
VDEGEGGGPVSAAYFFMVWEEAVDWAAAEWRCPVESVGLVRSFRRAVPSRRTTPDFATEVQDLAASIVGGAATVDGRAEAP